MQMQHLLTVSDLFLPAREYATEAIHPAMCSYLNSARSLKIGVFARIRLFFLRPEDIRFCSGSVVQDTSKSC